MLKVKKLRAGAQLPKYQTEGAACFDLHAVGRAGLSKTIHPGHAVTFDTGLAFSVPRGWTMLVYSRSGHGFKSGVRLSNCVGVIDSDYRGELMVRLQNDGDDVFTVASGDRIAQAMLFPAAQFQIEEVSDLDDTPRGIGGFGSTGK